MREVLAAVLVLVVACASSQPPAPESASAPTPASASAPAPAPESAPAPATSASATPPPTGGAVLVGDILAPKQFDPKPTVDALKPKMLDCYNERRAALPSLHGKLRLRIQINERGNAIAV